MLWWTCNKFNQCTVRPVFPATLHIEQRGAGGEVEQMICWEHSGFRNSVQFNHSVMPDSLWSHELQHARLPCPSPTPGACSNSSPSSQGCHPTISSSAIPFSSCLQSWASRSSAMSQFFASGSQSIRASASASVLPVNIQDWFPLGLTGFLLAVQGTLKSLLQHHSSKASIPQWLAFFMVQISHPHMTAGKTIALTRWTFVSKVMSLLFNMLSRFVIAFLPRSKNLFISWLQSPSAVFKEWQGLKQSGVVKGQALSKVRRPC